MRMLDPIDDSSFTNHFSLHATNFSLVTLYLHSFLLCFSSRHRHMTMEEGLKEEISYVDGKKPRGKEKREMKLLHVQLHHPCVFAFIIGKLLSRVRCRWSVGFERPHQHFGRLRHKQASQRGKKKFLTVGHSKEEVSH